MTGLQDSGILITILIFPLPMKILVILQALALFRCAAMTDELYEEEPEFESKRQWSLSSDCSMCITYNDPEYCTRCLNSKSSIPFHMAKRAFIMSRSTRNSGCGCCLMSRFTNNYCCQICKAAKRGVY